MWSHAVLFHAGEDDEHRRGNDDDRVFNPPVAEDFVDARLEAGHIQ